MKSAFIGIIGRPNVGKSTILNAMLGEKLAIATEKPQTTRSRIRGIYNYIDSGESAQIVFVDTPGIHNPRNRLGDKMQDISMGTINESDALIFIIDNDKRNKKGNSEIVEKLREIDTPKILVINKTDTFSPDEYKATFEQYEKMNIFDRIIGCVASENINVDVVIEASKKYAKEGPIYFPDNILTDEPERFIVAEKIREKALMYLNEEVPHGIAVEIESFEEKKNIIEISAVIYCEKKSHKGIIIGKNGRKLKGIGTSARKDIEEFLGTKVFLELWVKVMQDWRNSDRKMKTLGFSDK